VTSADGGQKAAPEPLAKARADWRQRSVIRRAFDDSDGGAPGLPPPNGLRAETGRGQVTLHWEPVPGAQGYLVHRAATVDGPFLPLDHGGGDVLAVPAAPYTDTTAQSGVPHAYAVSSVPAIEAPIGALTTPVIVAAAPFGQGKVEVAVDVGHAAGRLERPWRPMIGSERLAILEHGAWSHGRPVGEEFATALRMAHRELGVRAVRAHAILHDDLGVYRESAGHPVHDFRRVDAIYDRVLALGLRPIVELSFMPRDLAADPSKTVFGYGAIASPPRDWARWEGLVGELTGHLVERYGLDEVREHWAFEVWNEPNLEVFWSGSLEEYMRLYDVSARAVKSVDPLLRVGGPATAAAGWIGATLEHVAKSGAALDYLSTHTYGNAPLDVRATAVSHGLGQLPIWWTEWGVTPTHFGAVNDAVFGAPFICHSMKSVQGRAEAVAYWVISDHFEELGRPERLFHGGFGLLTVGNLRKPRYWALRMLELLHDDLVACHVSGDGAGGLVDAWATRHPDGRIAVLVWNGTLDQSRMDGDALLEREVTVRIERLPAGAHELRHRRVDESHSNIKRAAEALDYSDWPDDRGWATLTALDRLDDLEPVRRFRPTAGRAEFSFSLPMPGVSLLELRPST